MKAFSRGGVKVAHIRDFDAYNVDQPIFYGILRGTGSAMRHLQYLNEDFWYLDNGYFDAIYMDQNKRKDMGGTYRIVKNDMLEACDIQPSKSVALNDNTARILLLPPSPYAAFMYDTTPEDWIMQSATRLSELGMTYSIRDKNDTSAYASTAKEYDAVL